MLCYVRSYYYIRTWWCVVFVYSYDITWFRIYVHVIHYVRNITWYVLSNYTRNVYLLLKIVTARFSFRCVGFPVVSLGGKVMKLTLI